MKELCDDVKSKINLYLPYKCHICNVKINIFNNKTVTSLDSFSHGGNGGPQTVIGNHCSFVAGIAGGDDGSDFRGVAPDVDFYLSKYKHSFPI